MTKKLHIAVLCGGQSAEHEVSLESAKNVVQALDQNRYNISIIFVSRAGEWILLDSPAALLNNPSMKALSNPTTGKRLLLNLGNKHPFTYYDHHQATQLEIDVIFPVLHGAHGEDGTLQGLLEMINVPYVGTNTLGSAVCMDKEFSKQLLHAAGIPVARWLVAYREVTPILDFTQTVEQLGLPFFVKPVNTGSSVGVSKVKTLEDFNRALTLAWKYDHKIMIEEFMPGREIECAVLGNCTLETALPGEIIPNHEFYSYEAKYLDPDGAILKIPAELPLSVASTIQSLAKKAFAILGCSGMARVDFFVTPDERVFLNELNTIPGFTQISMYPALWINSGLPYPELINRLVALALERFSFDRVLVSKNDIT